MLIRMCPDLDTAEPNASAAPVAPEVPKPSSTVGQGLKDKVGQTIDDHLSGIQLLFIFVIIGAAGYIYSKHRGKTNHLAKDY